MGIQKLTLLLLIISLHSSAEQTCHNPHHLHEHTKNLSHITQINHELREDLGALSNCIDLNRYSCLYQTEESTNATLVIYHRGHWGSHRGNIPLEQRDSSLQQAIKFYDLDSASIQLKSSLLISASSNVGFTIKEIEVALTKAGLPKTAKVVLASHSGGYVGLLKTLNYLKASQYSFTVSQIVMLDNFYFKKESTSLIKSFVEEGAKCSGYLTSHNSTRFEERFRSQISPELCSIKLKRDHNKAVNKCLSEYIKTQDCLKEI